MVGYFYNHFYYMFLSQAFNMCLLDLWANQYTIMYTNNIYKPSNFELMSLYQIYIVFYPKLHLHVFRHNCVLFGSFHLAVVHSCFGNEAIFSCIYLQTIWFWVVVFLPKLYRVCLKLHLTCSDKGVIFVSFYLVVVQGRSQVCCWGWARFEEFPQLTVSKA